MIRSLEEFYLEYERHNEEKIESLDPWLYDDNAKGNYIDGVPPYYQPRLYREEMIRLGRLKQLDKWEEFWLRLKEKNESFS